MTKKVPPKNKAQEPKAQPKVQAPKGRNISAQGNALGNAAKEDQSPEGAEPSAGWRYVTIKDIAESIQYGHTASAIENASGPRFLRITDFQDGRVEWQTVPSCEIPAHEIPKYRLAEGDLVFARTGATTGKSFLIGECPEAVFASYLIRVRVSKVVDSRFLAAFFQSPDYWHQIEGGKRGIGQPNVNGTVLGEIRMPLPPLDDQRRMVAEIEKQFTRLEAGVAALRRVQANLKRYRAAVLKAACEGRLVPTEAELSRSGVPPLNPDSTAKPASSKAGSKVSTSPKRQDAASTSTSESGQQLLARILTERRQNWQGRGKYKEPEGYCANTLPELPNGWIWATVEQLAAPELNSITDGPFGSNLKTEHYTSSGPRVIRLQNIGDGVYVDEEAHITEEHFERLKKHRVFANDVVIAGFGENPPRSCIIPESLGPAIVKADCIRFKPHSDVLSKYVNTALNSDPVRKRTKGMVHGVGRPRLNLGEIKSIVLPLPPLAEQTRIVAEVERRLSVVEELEAVVTTNLQRATRLRQAVLQKAFAGEL